MQGLACYTLRAGLRDEPLAASLDLIAVEGDTEEGRGVVAAAGGGDALTAPALRGLHHTYRRAV